MTTCLLSPTTDEYCGQPAHHLAQIGQTELPICDDCREYLLHNEWPYRIRQMEEAS